MDLSDIPPYHKIIYQCGECGLEKEDSQIFHYVNKGWDFFIENLEPMPEFWKCPSHLDGCMHIRTQEIKSHLPQIPSPKNIDQMKQR
jgi:hypothetical protein